MCVCARERVCVCWSVKRWETWMRYGWVVDDSQVHVSCFYLDSSRATSIGRRVWRCSIYSIISLHPFHQLPSIPSFLRSSTVAWCRCCTTFVMCVRMATCVGLLCFVCMYILYTVSIQPTLWLLDKVRGLKDSCLANWCNLTVFGRYNVSTISEWYRYILENKHVPFQNGFSDEFARHRV